VNHSHCLRLTFTFNDLIKKKISLLIVITFLGWVVQISAQSNTIKIMPLGDSITWGINPDDPDSVGYRDFLYVQLISAGYIIDFVGSVTGGGTDPNHEGHPSWTAYNPLAPNVSLLDSLPKFLINNPPDVILLHIGTNDISSSLDFDEGSSLANEVIDILDTIYFFNNSITTIVAKIIDRNDNENRHTRTMNFNDTLEIKIDSLLGTRNQNIIIVDMYNALGLYFGTPVNSNQNFTYWTASNTNLLYDLHPNTTGYGVMADLWFDSLRTVLPLLVDVKVFLEGPYDNVGNTMSTALNSAGYLPLMDPYLQGDTVGSIPSSDIVDWVLVELRDKTNASTVIASRAGFIKNNGEIVDINGTSKLNFSGIPFDDYYITVKHRNHLAVMSNSPATLSDYTLTYNFTTGSGQFAGGSVGAKEIESGVWGMIAGNSDGNNSISFGDFNAVSNNLFQIGYKLGDHNMNGSVSVSDYNQVSNNLFSISQVP
jgi:lysophospholipase L1-like esterase